MAKLYPRCQPRVGVSCKFVSSTAVSWSGGILFRLRFSGKVFYVGCICRLGRCWEFYLSIGWNNLLLKALLVKINTGVAIIQSPL